MSESENNVRRLRGVKDFHKMRKTSPDSSSSTSSNISVMQSLLSTDLSTFYASIMGVRGLLAVMRNNEPDSDLEQMILKLLHLTHLADQLHARLENGLEEYARLKNSGTPPPAA